MQQPLRLPGTHPKTDRRSTQVFSYALVFVGLGLACVLSVVATASLDQPTLAGFLVLAGCASVVLFASVESLLLVALAAMVLAGALQSTTIALNGSGRTLLIDDVAFVIVAVTSVWLAWRNGYKVALALLAVALALTALAMVRSPVFSVATYQARQVMTPILCVFAGFVAMQTSSPRDRATFYGIVVAVAVGAALYGFWELLVAPPIDPLASISVTTDPSTIRTRNGLPNNFYFFTGEGSDYRMRVGGPFVNPPVAGIFYGTAAVIAWWMGVERRRGGLLLIAVALGTLTVLTWARGGMLVMAVGLLFPLAVDRFGRKPALVVLAIAAVVVGVQVASQGSSDLHYSGVNAGLIQGVTNPAGNGFGSIGNAAKRFDAGAEVEGESLAAIPFAAAGLPAIALFILGLGTLLAHASARNWEAGLGAGILVCALFTESASSLSGASLAWIVAGIALAKAPRLRLTLLLPPVARRSLNGTVRTGRRSGSPARVAQPRRTPSWDR